MPSSADNTPVRRLLALALAAWLALAGPAQGQEPAEPPAQRVYIVQLREPAAVAAPQTRRSLSRTGRFDARSGAVRNYAATLVERHDALLAEAGASPDAKVYSYRLAFNGFAARLTAAQAAALAAHPAVARVWEDGTRTLRSNASASFLGLLDAADGLRSARGLKGEGIVIGVIDSGIAPGHPSFADTEPGARPRACRSDWGQTSLLGRWLCRRFKSRVTTVYDPPEEWNGRCEAGEGFGTRHCNNKLIGARFYADGFQASYAMDENEFMSPRDADGHGTHLASVAAGNRVRAEIGAKEVATISGIAPRARIAAYKACWLQPGATRATCAMSDLQRAIEDAVADGVDIINYAVGTAEGSPADPDALALLAASDAGVLAVVAAGNGGPLARSIESPGSAPWVLTVAAASRAGERYDDSLRVTAPEDAKADLSAREAAFTPTLRGVGAVAGELVRVDDGEPDEVGSDDACEDLLNAAEIDGKIALVRRGQCSFQDKIERAEEAGALAVVVYSDSGAPFTMTGERGSVNVPALMISQADGAALVTRLDDGEVVEVRLEKGLIARRSDAGNVLFAQSARGPNPVLPDLLKPDVVAPGVDILGAQTRDVANGVRGERYQYLSGTSMAVPQVAGVAALLMEAHPDWSPAAIRSALVTSARQDLRKEDGVTAVDAFDVGGGYIVPNAASAPGLVFDAGPEDYDAFACGAGIARLDEAGCAALVAAGYPTEAWQLNLPSLAVSDLVAPREARRRVTNVGPAARYAASVSAPPGVAVTVTPATLDLAAGETAEFTVRLENLGATARLGSWGYGAVTWSSAEAAVRMPLAVKPEALAVPAAVNATGAEGSTSYAVDFGYDGTFAVTAAGLAAAEVRSDHVTDDPLNLYAPLDDDAALPDHVRRFRVVVPEGTAYLRIAIAATDEGATDDIDLYVACPASLCPDGSAVLAAASTRADEYLDILDPPPGEYVIDVHGYETDETVGGPGASFELGTWMVSEAGGAGSFAAAATGSASLGAQGQVALAWQGLEPDVTYLGIVSHDDGEQVLARTLVEILGQ